MGLKSKVCLGVVRSIVAPVRCNLLVLFVTAHCNARCRMCFYGDHIENANDNNELTLEEIKKISKNMGPLAQLIIGGGEPFLRKDLVDIVEQFVINNKVPLVVIPTNGSMPERIVAMVEHLCQRLPDTWLRITVSFDGWGEMHNEIRRVKDLFTKTRQTALDLRKLKDKFPQLSLTTCTILSKYNADNIEEVLDNIYNGIKPDLQVLGWPRGKLWDEDAGKVSVEQYEKATQHLIQRRAGLDKSRYPFKRLAENMGIRMADIATKTLKEQRMVIPCKAGQRMLVIDETGEVYPCETLQHFLDVHKTDSKESLKKSALGNLRNTDYDMKFILSSEKAQKVLKFIQDRQCHCTYEPAKMASTLFEVRQLAKVCLRTVQSIFVK